MATRTHVVFTPCATVPHARVAHGFGRLVTHVTGVTSSGDWIEDGQRGGAAVHQVMARVRADLPVEHNEGVANARKHPSDRVQEGGGV